MNEREILALGGYFCVFVVLLFYLLLSFWPERAAGAREGAPAWATTASVFGFAFQIGFETRLIILTLVAGALGSYIHSATSFATYVGNRTITTSWVWWYLLRTPIGMSLALLFYLLVRGGLLSAGAAGESVNPFGVAAIAGLAGMFSKQATDKLRELFDTLFQTRPGQGDDQRVDKSTAANPVPTLRSIQPATVATGAQELGLEVSGENFAETAVVRLNGEDQPTLFVTASKLTAKLRLAALSQGDTLKVVVFNPPPGGGVSEVKEIQVV